MIATVDIDADGHELRFWLQQGQLIHSALLYLLAGEASDNVLRVWLGLNSSQARAFEQELLAQISAVHKAYEIRESRDSIKVVLPVTRAHLVYCVLTASTRQTGSEEEYSIQVGYFKEHALELAENIVAVIRGTSLGRHRS